MIKQQTLTNKSNMTESASYVPAKKTDVLAGFPTPVEAISGEPTLRELLRILKHIMMCAILFRTESNNGLNMLHQSLPLLLYRNYVSDPDTQDHPGDADDPGERPIFSPLVNPNPSVWKAELIKWERKKKKKEDKKTMDTALVE